MKKSLGLLTFFLLFFALPAFGADYNWTGLINNNWAFGPNWDKFVSHPQENDTAYIDGSHTVIIDQDIKTGAVYLKNGATLDVQHKFTIVDAIYVDSASTVIVHDNVEFNAKIIETAGTFTLGSGSKLNVSGDFTNTGTFTADANSVITATGASGTFKGGGITVPNFVYAPDSTGGTGLKIEDENTFTKFTCAGDATININDQTTIGTAFIAGDVTVNMNAGISATTLNIDKESRDLASSWKTTFNGSGKVECASLEIFRASGTDGVIGTLEVDCPMECSGTLITHSGTTLSVKSGKTLTAQKIENQGSSPPLHPARIENAGTITLNATSGDALSSLGPVSNSGIIEAAAGAMTFADTVTNSGALKTSAGEMKFSGEVAGTGGTITTTSGNITCAASTTSAEALGTVTTDTGTLQNTGSGAVSATSFTMNGNAAIKNTSSGSIAITTVTAKADASVINSGSGANTFNNFSCAEDGANITLSGANTFTNFTMTSGGGTLTVDGAQEVTTLTLKGTGTGANVLNVNGSGSIKLGENQHSGDYLSVERLTTGGIKILPDGSSGFYYSATHSSFTAEEYLGEHNHWILLGDNMEFKWTGGGKKTDGTTADPDWSNPANWNYNLVPGTAAEAIGGVSTKENYPVLIPNTPSKNASNFPVVTKNDGYSITDLTIGESASSGANLTVQTNGNEQGAIKLTGALKNSGTIIYNRKGRITKGGTFINDADETTPERKGTVEFTGTVEDADDISTPSAGYYNLTISGSKKYYAAGALMVRNALLVSGESAACAGSVWFNNSAAGTATSAATVRFNTSGTISLGNNAGDSFEVKGAALELPAASDTLGGLALGGKIKAGGTGIKLSMDAALAADTAFESPLTLGATAILKAPASGTAITVTTDDTLTSAAYTLALENANLTNTGSADGANVKFTGSANREQSFAPNASSTYKNVTIDKTKDATTAAMEMTMSAELKTESLAINQNVKTTFAGKVTVTDTGSYSDEAAAGDILFNAGCDFAFTASDAEFKTTGTLTLNGATNDCSFNSDLIHTAGRTNIRGNLKTNGAAINFAATTIQADVEITTTNGAATFGATTLSGNLKLDAGSGEATFGTISGAKNFSSLGSGKVNFNGNIGQPAPLAKLASITVDGPVAVAASSANIATTGLQHYKGDISFGGACAVAGEVQAAGSVAASGAVSFDNNVWLYTSAAATLGGTGGSLTITGNLYFVGESKAASVASNVTAKNVLLLHGTVDIAASATLASSTGDMIMLGADYSVDDIDAADKWRSQVAGLFAYKPAAPLVRKCAASYTEAFTKACPDGTTVSAPWSGAVTTSAGAKISAGQNFYANGLASLGSGAWTLLLKDNNKQSDAFAEVYNSKISNCTASPIAPGGTVFVMAAENKSGDVTGCSANIVTSRPVIAKAYTVYDDTIYVSFKASDGSDVIIENSDNEISAAAAKIFNSSGAFASTFTENDCLPIHSTNGKGDIAGGFYIKSSNKWNTDASGTSAGDAGGESSDRSGTRQGTIPCLNIPKALDALYETLRDRAKNRIAHYNNGHATSASPDTSAVNNEPGTTFTDVADNCAPVLVQVLTGQELHQNDPALQKDYDARNFVEFVYSEPVDISDGSTTVLDSDVNIRAAADLGATASDASGITFAGLAKTLGGKIDASLRTGSGSPHALYKNFYRAADGSEEPQARRIRVSIAGWRDGTVLGGFKNWPGYISSAATPSGAAVERISNDYIKDRSPAKNKLDADASAAGHALPILYVSSDDSDGNKLYGPWDTTPPSFAPVRINGSYNWEKPATDGSQEYEFVGASYSTGTLSAIELHWFDNEPTYANIENPQWFSRVGWAAASSATEYGAVKSYAADIRGGSRPDSAGNNKTSGGIRYCTLFDANGAFSYAVDGSETYYNFTQNIKAGAESSLFTYAGSDAGAVIHTTGAEDGLYCKLLLDQTSYVLQTTFLLTFDSDACFITDLAGNRIQCGKVKMKSIDRTPPAFTMSAVPLGTKNMLVIFSKTLNTSELTVYKTSTIQEKVPALEWIPKSLELVGSSGIAIDQGVAAKCLFKTKNATGLLLALNKNATLNDITSGIFVRAKSVESAYDPLAGVTAAVTYIQDAVGNYVVDQTRHAFSDFAVNAVQPQYAYDNSITDDGGATNFGLYQDGSWAVRDWNAEQANYGTLHAGKEIILQTVLYDGTADKSGGLDPATGGLASGTVSAFFSAKPDPLSVSTKINENTNFSWRIWQPNFTSDIFGSLAPTNNKTYVSVDGKKNDSGVMFDIEEKTVVENWKSGDQISFVFKLGDYTVDHYADGTNYPLYAIRLKDLSAITSLDLWSFKIKATTLQRGGVTILNNVINVENGENTVVQVDLKEAGNLNVIVMTLDGNIVKYLRHGHTDMGTHYYNWNGTNNGGSKVARGLYFVRVIGPGIDETRKVMCVK